MLEIIEKFEKLLETIGNDVKHIKVVVEKLAVRLDPLENKVEKLGGACKIAFEQTKVVINKLHQHQILIGESLDSYGGVIEASTWNF